MAADPSSTYETVDSDFVVILAALLHALICALGLIAVARYAWIRRLFGGGHGAAHSSANKGLKKKVLPSLPKLTFSEDLASKLADCPICLSEFVAGDEICVLPQCGHAFHVVCVDTWLGSHSSCPSCRQILAVERCQRCGGLPADTSPASEPPVTKSVIEVGYLTSTLDAKQSFFEASRVATRLRRAIQLLSYQLEPSIT